MKGRLIEKAYESILFNQALFNQIEISYRYKKQSWLTSEQVIRSKCDSRRVNRLAYPEVRIAYMGLT